MIPKFLHADDGHFGREFIIHTQEPRVLIEFRGDLGEIVQWFDDQGDFMSRSEHAGREPARELSRLMREAGEFYVGN